MLFHLSYTTAKRTFHQKEHANEERNGYDFRNCTVPISILLGVVESDTTPDILSALQSFGPNMSPAIKLKVLERCLGHVRRYEDNAARATKITAAILFSIFAAYLIFRFRSIINFQRVPAQSNPPSDSPEVSQEPTATTMDRHSDSGDELPAYEDAVMAPRYILAHGRDGVQHTARSVVRCDNNIRHHVRSSLAANGLLAPPVTSLRGRAIEPLKPWLRIPIIGTEPDGLTVSVADAPPTPSEMSRCNSVDRISGNQSLARDRERRGYRESEGTSPSPVESDKANAKELVVAQT